MDARVSSLESKFDDVQNSQNQIKLAIAQLQSVMVRFVGGSAGESSEATLGDPQFQNPMNPNAVRHEIGQNFNHHPRSPFLKMEFPRFPEEDDPLGWIYKAEHYFDFFGTDDAQKVRLASFHMEGEELQWFQWARCLTTHPSWEEFIKILCQEFGPSEMEDSAESLVKLRQDGTLRDYVLEFRRLANRTRDISPKLLRSCFIGGLKPKLQHDVKLLRPKDVLEAAASAQQIDTKITELKVRSLYKSPIIQPTFRSPASQNVTPTIFPDNRAKNTIVRRLTPEKVDHCRKNGLCYHCKEKFVRGHTCEKKQLLLIDVQDSVFDDDDGLGIQEPEITACALFGTPAPASINTMKVSGLIRNCHVTINRFRKFPQLCGFGIG